MVLTTPPFKLNHRAGHVGQYIQELFKRTLTPPPPPPPPPPAAFSIIFKGWKKARIQALLDGSTINDQLSYLLSMSRCFMVEIQNS